MTRQDLNMSSETVGIKHSDLVEVSWKVVGFTHEADPCEINQDCVSVVNGWLPVASISVKLIVTQHVGKVPFLASADNK